MNYKTNIINEFTAELSDRMDADNVKNTYKKLVS